MRKLVVVAAFALMMLLTGRAHAAGTGYSCYVEYFPTSSSYGNNGYVSTGLYSGTNCTGSFIGMMVFPTTGSTTCTSYQLSADALIGLLQALRQQMSNNQKVWINTVSASSNCAQMLDFYSN